MANDQETQIGTIEQQDSNEEGRISGYIAKFNTLSENLGGFREQITEGNFDGVSQNDALALFNHNPNLILVRTIAGSLSLVTDETGLRYWIDPPDTQPPTT